MKNKKTRYTKYLIIDTLWLMEYFNVCNKTIKRWIKNKKIDPTNIEMLVEYRKQRS